ncbi:hypothetical protein HN873_029923, partial [Arachis hypogaea]
KLGNRVGDPAQLSAAVISDVAKNHGYGTSLFERLMQAGYPVKMLKTQYRMHPEVGSYFTGKVSLLFISVHTMVMLQIWDSFIP